MKIKIKQEQLYTHPLALSKMSNLAPILHNHVFCCTGLSSEAKVKMSTFLKILLFQNLLVCLLV
jgi:hypothetical protein